MLADEHQHAFEQLQDKLITASLLSKPDYSRKLRESECIFPIVDLEALAVLESVCNYNAYLYHHRDGGGLVPTMVHDRIHPLLPASHGSLIHWPCIL